MGLGRLMLMFIVLICFIAVASNIGYRVGHASGVIETTSKINEQLEEQQTASTQNASAPYASVSSNPIGDVQTNPFDYSY